MQRGVFFMPANRAVSYSVSQNFLTCQKTIRRLIDRTTIEKTDHVLEIGAGKGHITRALLDACREVTAYEIDPRLGESLRKNLGERENLRLVFGDFLAAPLPARGDYKVFSNIPFSITTAIVRKLASAPNPPKETWLVVEKGAAKRFLGMPRETAMSLSLKPFFRLEIAYHFAREDFHPMPRADCVLLHLARRDAPEIGRGERAAFSAFIKEEPGRFLSKKQISTALRLGKLPPAGASAEMLYVQWLCLFRCWRQFGRKLT
jgi:23S rRNA (adenine-N6)-dimethyltransferase